MTLLQVLNLTSIKNVHHQVNQLLASWPDNDPIWVKVIKAIVFLVKVTYCLSELFQTFAIKRIQFPTIKQASAKPSSITSIRCLVQIIIQNDLL